MGELLDSKFGRLASKDDLEMIVTDKVDAMSEKVRTNAEDISLLHNAVTRLEGGQHPAAEKEIRKTVSSIIREESGRDVRGRGHTRDTGFLAGARCQEQVEAKKIPQDKTHPRYDSHPAVRQPRKLLTGSLETEA